MSRTLVDEVTIVTGAISEIGAGTAHELAQRGVRVVLAARRMDELDAQVMALLDQCSSLRRRASWRDVLNRDVSCQGRVRIMPMSH